MPRATDPDAIVEIVLDCDEGKKPTPTFLFRPPTMRDEARLGNYWDRLTKDESTDQDALLKITIDTLGPNLVGWKNIPGYDQFEPKFMADFLCNAEGAELIHKLLASGRLSADEKKSSEQSPSSEADCSAKPASEETAEKPTRTLKLSVLNATEPDAMNANTGFSR